MLCTCSVLRNHQLRAIPRDSYMRRQLQGQLNASVVRQPATERQLLKPSLSRDNFADRIARIL